MEIRGTVKRDENGTIHISPRTKNDASKLEAVFLDWITKGYIEVDKIGKGGQIKWLLTPSGIKNIKTIVEKRKDNG
ncbi:unnamed protein product [marine sediment metagenome]|uniref:ArnR1-like winged helix-turn-helix domain-containing protein n=1 Tax=marine sediment metagenome TaxID=412755 RepID=X1SXQ1_9ZZZZ